MAMEKTILIVDDDVDYAASMSCFLAVNGYKVIQARDGREALKLAKMHRPSLILMDIMMDERTEGFFTVQEVRRTNELRDVPIFVLSALYSKVPDFEIDPNRGWLSHDEFFAKPPNMDVLLSKIRQRIGDPRHENVEASQG
jgi:DNA-binding response OmpR family regulator